MAAYAIGSLTLHNTEWQGEYGARMPVTSAAAPLQGLRG